MAESGQRAFHIPAMPEECIEFLRPSGDGLWLDGTVGGGGHARLICSFLGSQAVFLGIDRDPLAIEEARRALEGCACRVELRRMYFGDVAEALKEFSEPLRGAILDLGLSSSQIDRGTGFSINDREAPLDMRQNPDQRLDAHQVINTYQEKALADLFYCNSDLTMSRRIAAAIVRERPLETVGQLMDTVKGSLPRGYRQADDVLRRVCQAIRMEVNDEMNQLTRALETIAEWMSPGGRLVILSYHSKEDGAVKQLFRRGKLEGRLVLLTPKPLRPTQEEIRRNPRSRPARLRAAEKI